MSSKIECGNRVCCINDKPLKTGTPSGLVEGRDYIVYSEKVCPVCKAVGIDVGTVIPRSWKGSWCGDCGYKYNDKPIGTRCYDASRFRKVEETTTKEVVYNVSKVTEDIPVSQN